MLLTAAGCTVHGIDGAASSHPASACLLSASLGLSSAFLFLQGVKGLLEAAGYTVYNPTLPYHFPNDTWNINDGLVTIQQYVDVYKGVSTPPSSDRVTVVD